MGKLKDIPKIDRPRERFLQKGADALSKSELLAILLGSGIKGKNVKQLSEQIIRKFGDSFLTITVEDLLEIQGIGRAKALQIISALELTKRFFIESSPKNDMVLSSESAISLTLEIRDKKKEHLVCLYLNARNVLLHKEIVSIGILDKSTSYVSDGSQASLFDLLSVDEPTYTPLTRKISKIYFSPEERSRVGHFQLQNRRYLGNKYKLLGFIEDILNEKCNGFESFCDIFAGTGVVGGRFNQKNIKVISNDILSSNYFPIKAFLGVNKVDHDEIKKKIDALNAIKTNEDNYFSTHFGNTYFTLENARKIGATREKIEILADSDDEKAVLIASLLYAVDKVANTVGHYDAFRKKLDTVQPLRLLVPDLDIENNWNNEIYREDANQLVKKITFDVLYIDPRYNSRQYSDAYHLLENLATWEKPIVHGIAKKMDRNHLKSEYCLKSAPEAFADLIKNAKCKHILVSYNNTGESKDGRSNARINDNQILNALKTRGDVDIFERDYKAFTAGKSNGDGHTERVFYCNVRE